MLRILAPTALALACAGPAAAHVALSQTEAPAGSYYVASFRVGHGCHGKPTVALRVELPAGVISAKPQPKTGWRVQVDRDGPRPTAVTWRGRLGDDQFDEFQMMVRLPETPGPLYFPTVQGCGSEEQRWVQIPAPGAAWTSVPNPAPVVTLRAAETAPHQH